MVSVMAVAPPLTGVTVDGGAGTPGAVLAGDGDQDGAVARVVDAGVGRENGVGAHRALHVHARPR